MTDHTIILGGGIAGLSLAYFLNRKTLILEAQEEVGGLCRSYHKNGIWYDVGPHIIFSKNEETLELMKALANTHERKRSNQIYFKGKFVKYPFENFLAQLKDPKDIAYCRETFLNNPYRNRRAGNMLEFFLKTFGEGITKLYLQPYNEKIWKFDPAMMDTQMVERIPRPPDQHIIDACEGKFSEGYLHQLHFHYPKEGGIFSLCKGFKERIREKTEIQLKAKVSKINKADDRWIVTTAEGNEFTSEALVNCMPLHELFACLEGVPEKVQRCVQNLKYNSIHIVIINVSKDTINDHFSMMFPQKDIFFHRLNRLNFLGPNYCLPDGSSTFLADVTFRKGTPYGEMSREAVVQKCIEDMAKLGFIDKRDVQFTDIHTEKYAYVIYDLDNKSNKEMTLSYLKSMGIEPAGRFAEFEYMNSDQVIDHSRTLAEKMNGALS